jgi:hypothetical protein
VTIAQEEPPGDAAPQLAAIYDQLNCVCGTCDLTLAACSDETAQSMKAEVAAALRDQKSEKEIIDQMVERYGRKVLRTAGPSAQQAAPEKSTPPSGAEELPAFAYNSAQALEGYRIATQIPEVLEEMPCYCGCGKQLKHRYLKDCFLKEGGSGFDDHGSGCNLCDSEAIDVKKWRDEKIPLKEIRAKIDEKYRKYGVPTPTPPIG